VTLRNTEPLAAAALEGLLRRSGVPSRWEPGADPPDVVFTVAGERWAVEETQLHQYLAADDGGLLAATRFREAFETMCRRIDERTRSSRTASYTITAFLPIAAVRPLVHRPLAQTERRALAYVRSGKVPAETLDDDAGKQVSIGVDTRAAPGANRITWWTEILPGVRAADGRSSGFDVRVNTEQALVRVLAEKTPQLGRLAGYDRRLLVITKSYKRAQLGQVRELLGEILTRDPAPALAERWDAVLFLFQEDEQRLYLGEDEDAPVDERRIIHRRGDLHVLATPTGWRFPQPESPLEAAGL
jgi:hypothetical protein